MTTAATTSTFDYIIVGAGTAGCVLANRLSLDQRNSVLLIEAGGMDDYAWIHIPVGYLYCIDNPRTDWRYRTEAEAGLNGRSLIYPRGKVLGGSSSINGMIYMRGQHHDYDGWAEAGNPGWSWDDVLPLFRKSENHWSLDDSTKGAPGDTQAERAERAQFHGHGGEWRVEKQRLHWAVLDAFRDAALEAGIPTTDDFNRGDNEGCGYFEVNQKRGVRWNASKAFLHPLLKGRQARHNLVVVTEALDATLDFDGKTCLGMSFRQREVRFTVQARAETILCAGSIGSPSLLQRAGIGAPERLQAAGIAVRHALPGVGENLQDHLQLRMAFKLTKARTLNTIANAWHGKALMGLQYIAMQRGPMAMAPSQLGAFARSTPDQPYPNVEYHVQPLSLDRFGSPLHTFPACTASVCNLQPASRGSVHVVSPDPNVAPKIAPNYLTAPADLEVAIDSIRLTRRIVSQPAMRRYAPAEFLPGPEFETDDELAAAAGNIGTTIFHPVGTCKMGPASDTRAVVDAELRVHGIARLRVVDSAIMPTITSGNTCSPTIMIAEKAAQMMVAAARG
ncbi:MAG: GMC family oxidoreductase N-terminal domain-containing protein [Burkholderiaceae bacterium]